MNKFIDLENIKSKNLSFKKIDEQDIHTLRELRAVGESLGYLNKITWSNEKMISYIKSIKSDPSEVYLKILNSEFQFIGTVKIIKKNETTFEWGSWVLRPDLPFVFSIETALVVYKFAIEEGNFKIAEFEVINTNEKVIRFHTNFGAIIKSKNEIKTKFEFSDEQIIKACNKYQRFCDKIYVTYKK